MADFAGDMCLWLLFFEEGNDGEHVITSMIFDPSVAPAIEEHDPDLAAPPASPPVLLSTYVAEEPLALDLNDAGSPSSDSSDNEGGVEDPNAMTIAEMINTIIEDGIVLPTEEEIAGRRAAAGLPAEKVEETSEELKAMIKEMIDLTYNEEDREQLLEDVLEELAARNEAAAEAVEEKAKGKGKEKAVVEEPEAAPAGPSTVSPTVAAAVVEEPEADPAAGPSTVSPTAAATVAVADDTWQGLSRLLGGDLLSDRDISTILSREEAAADEAGKPFNMIARMMQYHDLNRAAQRTPAEAKQAVVAFLERTRAGPGGKLADEMMDKLKDGVGMSRQERRAADRKAKKGGKQ